jgi:hypothetical protein
MSISSFSKAAFTNFTTSIRIGLFLPMRNRPDLHTSSPHLICALLFSLCAALVFWAYWMWPISSFSIYGFADYLAQSAWFYFWIAAILSMFSLSGRFMRMVITLCYITPIALLASIGMNYIIQTGVLPIFVAMGAYYLVAYLFTVTTTFRIIWGTPNSAKWKAVPVTAGAVIASIAGSMLIGNAPLFEHDYEEVASTTTEPAYQPASAEEIYYAQPHLMAQETAQLHTQTDGVKDTYAVLGAGYAEQSVFLNEVTSVQSLLKDTFGALNSTITLANSRPSPTRHPLLNPINLRAAINAAADKMNTKEDTLVLFLTSHGSPESISTSFYELRPTPILSFELAEILDASEIQNMVVILSACYSGSFIDDIQAPGRTIITAAASDRSSFGCADGRDWTEFGRAYFGQAFRQTGNFVDSYHIAKDLVHEWELEQGQKPSLPQISIDGHQAEQTAAVE